MTGEAHHDFAWRWRKQPKNACWPSPRQANNNALDSAAMAKGANGQVFEDLMGWYHSRSADPDRLVQSPPVEMWRDLLDGLLLFAIQGALLYTSGTAR